MFDTIAAGAVTDLVGTVVAVAGIVATFLVFRWQREKKRLDYEFLSGSRLLSQQAMKLKQLELRYEDEVIADPYLMLVRFRNTGNKPITLDDFEWPVHIEAEGLERAPLSAGVAQTSNPDLRAEVTTKPDGGTLEPLLLNPGDWVTMSLLLDGEPSSWNVRGRVVGVKEFRSYRPPRSVMDVALLIIGLLLFGSVLIFSIYGAIDVSTGGARLTALFVAAIAAVALLLTIQSYRKGSW